MSLILGNETSRPRDVDAKRAAAILYGDWGTSKAYVIGLAFAVAGYSSFWLILAMCLITGLVALNYVIICKHYPNGGGVYASVRHRSEVISIVGAFLLIADYIVTAALSALPAFTYLRLPHPEIFAALAIAGIGALNLLGPKSTGGVAVAVSVPTVIVVLILSAFCVPHLREAIHNVQPLTGGFLKNWNGLVAIVLALSGVEAIANATGVMKLDPGSSPERPSVMKTAKPALLWIALEVCVLTAFLGLGMHALGGLHTIPGDSSGMEVTAPGAPDPGVRDYMLRWMGQQFVGGVFGSHVGEIFGWLVAGVFGMLLLSAVNTAIGGLITVQFLMARDGEMPPVFKKLNSYGVPKIGTIIATLIPAALVLLVSDVSGLADLYAVGVVGAIACNLGATSTDKTIPLGRGERAMMFFTFLLMTAIEISLFIDKPNARIFAAVILVVGLIMRELAKERAARKKLRDEALAASRMVQSTIPGLTTTHSNTATSLATSAPDTDGEPMLCAVRGMGRTLDFALREAEQTHRPLYLLFVREQTVITAEDRRRKWASDEDAGAIFRYAKSKAEGKATVLPCYAVSDSAAGTIVDVAATVGASRAAAGRAKTEIRCSICCAATSCGRSAASCPRRSICWSTRETFFVGTASRQKVFCHPERSAAGTQSKDLPTQTAYRRWKVLRLRYRFAQDDRKFCERCYSANGRGDLVFARAEIRVTCDPCPRRPSQNPALCSPPSAPRCPWRSPHPARTPTRRGNSPAPNPCPPPRGLAHHVQTVEHNGEAATLHFVSFDASHDTFVLYDQGELGRASLAETMAANHCLAGTNGGYFQPDFEPVGLLVAGGKLVRGPSRARLLSGALIVTGNHITLRRSTEPLPGKHAREAVQSGPFLVDAGKLVPGLNNVRSARRTAVFTDGGRRWGLVSTTALTLEELGTVLADPALLPWGAKIEQALNLDGGSSTSLWAEQPGQTPLSLREFGIVRDFVGIVPRVGRPVKK